MPSINDTVRRIVSAKDWHDRVAALRLVPQHHGTGEHAQIYAEVAQQQYVPLLAPDYAYVHDAPYYDRPYFVDAYNAAASATRNFEDITEAALVQAIVDDPRSLLIFRTILGLTSQEFGVTTNLIAEPIGEKPVSPAKIKSAEMNGIPLTAVQATIVARTIEAVVSGTIFGAPHGDGLHVKQEKIDTANGWPSVQNAARNGVPYVDLLHQRHYGGAFRQVLDATSTKRGNLLEDAVEGLFTDAQLSFIRTGSHNQGDVQKEFGILVTPAPDFVVFDGSGRLRAMLECKLVNDGGTARDKAPRFARLRDESIRLGGVPLFAVLAGLGWARVNDTLGPVVRDTDGRVFTLANLDEMLTVEPFPTLM